jgi:hypothetical protein
VSEEVDEDGLGLAELGGGGGAAAAAAAAAEAALASFASFLDVDVSCELFRPSCKGGL